VTARDDAEEEPAAAAKEEEVEEVQFADLAIPALDELRSALEWAFEREEAPAEFLDRCAEHALLVQTRNRVTNLTKIVEPREIAAKHYRRPSPTPAWAVRRPRRSRSPSACP
jgi:hypothetical protein